jgi:signal transduction histidine kinase
VIGGTAEVIRDTTADDNLHEALGAIMAAVGHGTDLSAQLLAYGAPGSAGSHETDVSYVARGLLPFLDRLVGADVDVELHGAEEPAIVGLVDNEIEQILMNVVLNAGQAMTGGGTVTLRISRAVEGSVAPPGDLIDVVRITVADTGPGIDDDRFPHIFDPYFTTRSEGTGLGLATVYRLVTGAGGRIAARNRDGGGAEFVITIPLLS